MNFSVKKIENCFADTETYEYLLPVSADAMRNFLNDWNVWINEKLRRPTMIAQKDDVIIKCILAGNAFRVSFPNRNWKTKKQNFEEFLRDLSWTE